VCPLEIWCCEGVRTRQLPVSSTLARDDVESDNDIQTLPRQPAGNLRTLPHLLADRPTESESAHHFDNPSPRDLPTYCQTYPPPSTHRRQDERFSSPSSSSPSWLPSSHCRSFSSPPPNSQPMPVRRTNVIHHKFLHKLNCIVRQRSPISTPLLLVILGLLQPSGLDK
jgi:hypothetical protein